MRILKGMCFLVPLKDLLLFCFLKNIRICFRGCYLYILLKLNMLLSIVAVLLSLGNGLLGIVCLVDIGSLT